MMPDSEENAVFGWSALAKMLGKSKRACMRRRKEYLQGGVIHYTYKMNSAGGRYKAMFFFPSSVKSYLASKSSINGLV